MVRGPDWKWADHDHNGIGTVVEFQENGWVNVRWDYGQINGYRFGDENAHDVAIAPKAPPLTIDDHWRVVAGPSCKDCPEDAMGEVTAHVGTGTNVSVHWDTGAVGEFVVGVEGVLPMGPPDRPIAIGARVLRGNDWHSNNDDRGAMGTVVAHDVAGHKARVRWDHGGVGDYDWGVDDHYEIEVIDGAPVVSIAQGWRVVAGPSCSSCPDAENLRGVVDSIVAATSAAPAHANVTWSNGTSTETVFGADGVLPAGLPLPPIAIGDRVMRGPDWKWANQDNNGKGTVIEMPDADSWLHVRWDHGGLNGYRWGAEGAFDLKRLPSEGPPKLALGARVIAGPRCNVCLKDQRGKVSKLLGKGMLRITWDDSSTVDVLAGVGGVLPRGDAPPPLAIGARVHRGRDWKWDDQDHGGLGTVQSHDSDDWVQVRWDTGDTNGYRWGAEGAFDLEVVPGAAPAPVITTTAPPQTQNAP